MFAKSAHLIHNDSRTFVRLVDQKLKRIRKKLNQLIFLKSQSSIAVAYGFVLIFVFLMSASHYFSQISRGGHPWETGDWLINYQSGFIRRGLIGELILRISECTNFDLLDLTFLFQLTIYFIFFLYNFKIVWFFLQRVKTYDNFKIIILLFSPAAILFNLYNLDFAFRKEIIGLALISWMYYTRLNVMLISIKFYLISIGCYIILIFSWEPGIAFLPFMITLFLSRNQVGSTLKSSDLTNLSIRIVLLASSLCFLLSLIFHGSSKDVGIICDSLSPGFKTSADICDGAVAAIGWDFSYFFHGSTLGSPLRLLGFLLLGFLSTIPLLNFSALMKHKVIALQFLFCFLFFNLLAADTGRMIYVFVICLNSQIIFDLARHADNDATLGRKAQTRLIWRLLQILGILFLVFGWFLPASGSPWRFLRI